MGFGDDVRDDTKDDIADTGSSYEIAARGDCYSQSRFVPLILQ